MVKKWLAVIASFFSKVWDFFLDKNGSGDEKRFWGMAYALAIPIYALFLHGTNSDLLKVLAVACFALLGGAVVGDKLNPKGITADPATNIAQYLRDLFLDKNGSGDEKRLLGNFILGVALVYVFTNPTADFNVLTLLVGFGCALLGLAIFGDVFGPTPPPIKADPPTGTEV